MFPSRALLIALGCGLCLLLASFSIDASIDRWVAAHRDAPWETIAKTASRYLAWPWLMFAAALGLLLAWNRRRRDWMRVLCAMIVAASLAGASADLLRGITGRTRPYTEAPQGWYGVRSDSRWLITKHAYNSFPSGHVSAMAGFALPLLFWRRPFGVLLLLITAAVATARVYLGAHHLSDVIAGALLGTMVAAWVWHWFGTSERMLKIFPPARESG